MSLSIQISRALKRVEASTQIAAARQRVRASEDEIKKLDLNDEVSVEDALTHLRNALKVLNIPTSSEETDSHMSRVMINGDFDELEGLKDYFEGKVSSRPALLNSQSANYMISGDNLGVTVSFDVGVVLLELV